MSEEDSFRVTVVRDMGDMSGEITIFCRCSICGAEDTRTILFTEEENQKCVNSPH